MAGRAQPERTASSYGSARHSTGPDMRTAGAALGHTRRRSCRRSSGVAARNAAHRDARAQEGKAGEGDETGLEAGEGQAARRRGDRRGSAALVRDGRSGRSVALAGGFTGDDVRRTATTDDVE